MRKERRKLRKCDLLTALYAIIITFSLLLKVSCDDNFYKIMEQENNISNINKEILKEITNKIYDDIYEAEKIEFLKQLNKFNKLGIIELDEDNYNKLLKKLKVNEGNKNKFYNDIKDIINTQNEYTY